MIKTAWYWHKNRCEEEWNRLEDAETTPSTFNYLNVLFEKGAKTHTAGKIVSLKNGVWKTGYPHAAD